MAKRARRHRNIINAVPSGIGVYEFWNFGMGRDYALADSNGPAKYLTALAELEQASKPGGKLPPGNDRNTKIWVPTLWKPGLPDGQEFKPRFIPFVLGRSEKDMKVEDNPEKLRARLLRGIALKKVRHYLESVDLKKSRFRAGLPIKAGAMHELELEPSAPHWQHDLALSDRIKKRQEAEKPGTAGEKIPRITIFAIIDDGLPFAHRNFRDADRKHTRVEFCWLQSAKADRRQKSVLFGREYTRKDIDEYIASHGDDEDALYRAAGATEDTEGLAGLLGRHTTHGAHVMDLATGYAEERDESPAEEIRIIAVQLPNLLTMDTSGVGKDMYLLSAFHYIFDRADRIADGYKIDRARLVINFSYGYFGGSHDGQIDAEAAISELIQMRRKLRGPTALVLPAGNSFLDRTHARIPEAKLAKGKACLQWRLQPADRTPNYVEMWFPPRFDPAGYTVAMHDPSGKSRGHLKIEGRSAAAKRRNGHDDKSRAATVFDDNHRVGLISVDHHRRRRWRVMIVTSPSEPNRCDRRGITPGAWTIVITRDANAMPLPQAIHCWIQRDTDPESLRSGGRQSYFDDPLDVRFNDDGSPREEDTPDALVQRFGSLNGLATSDTSIMVAGFRLGAGLGSSRQDVRPARYSCAGPRNEELPEARINCASMSDRALALPGTVAAGVRSGSRSILNGTSVAAPFVARQLATTFVCASDDDVEQAERYNYLPLLRGGPPPAGRRLTDRLGEVLAALHWQPDIDPLLLARDEGTPGELQYAPPKAKRVRRAG